MTATTAQLGARITQGPMAWQVLQREADGCATVALAGTWYADGQGTVEARVAREADQTSVAGCDWCGVETREDGTWRATLRVPTGGLYRIETRVHRHGDEWRLTGDKVWHIAVGDVWLIAGQSNAVGYGHGQVDDAPTLGVSVFGGNGLWRLATHPIFDPTDTRYPACRDGGWVDVSPWLAFGRTVLREAGIPVGLIPTALGGSPLSAWDPGNPDGAFLYENMLAMVQAAGGRIAGVVWYQGESDATPELCDSYLARFRRFVEGVRGQYGEVPVLTAQLNRVVLDPPEDWRPRPWSVIREAQRQAARQIPELAVVPTVDLPLSDFIHTGAMGNVTLGLRFGQAALGMVYGQDVAWRAPEIAVARFIDESHTCVRVGFAHVSGHLTAVVRWTLPEFAIEDADGALPLADARLTSDTEVTLTLSRPARGTTRCHLMPGEDPPCTLRDDRQWPPLACHGFPVQDAQDEMTH